MRMWNRLLKHGFKDLFVSLFQKYSVRLASMSPKVGIFTDPVYDQDVEVFCQERVDDT